MIGGVDGHLEPGGQPDQGGQPQTGGHDGDAGADKGVSGFRRCCVGACDSYARDPVALLGEPCDSGVDGDLTSMANGGIGEQPEGPGPVGPASVLLPDDMRVVVGSEAALDVAPALPGQSGQ